MKNNTEDMKFVTSNKATDICLARAKYMTEIIGEDLTKKNINKNYKRCLKEYREFFSKNTTQEVGTLRCLETNTEIGFYLKTSYQEWDSLSILYVNPDFRGQGHSQTLISLYDMNCKEASVIELSVNDYEEQKSLYEDAGYTKTVGHLFPTSIGLIKEDSFETLTKAVQGDSISYSELYKRLVEITKDCSSKLEIGEKFPQIQEVFELFNDKEQLIHFCYESLLDTPNENYLLNEFLRDFLEMSTASLVA